MSILSGIKKVIPYFKNADGNYEQLSYKTSSQTVDFDDGKTAETKLGAINGITKSLNSTSDSVAISASAGKSLQDQITTLNSNIERTAKAGKSLQDQITTLNSNIERTAKAGKSLQDQITTLNRNISTANTKITALTNKNTIYDSSIAGGNNRIANHLDGGGQAYLNIRYTESFKHTPTVVATINHSYTDILKVSVYNCSKTGCTLQVKNVGSVGANDIYVNWIAFDYLAF